MCEICSKLTIKTPERRRISAFADSYQDFSHFLRIYINPFLANVTILNPLKTPENK